MNAPLYILAGNAQLYANNTQADITNKEQYLNLLSAQGKYETVRNLEYYKSTASQAHYQLQNLARATQYLLLHGDYLTGMDIQTLQNNIVTSLQNANKNLVNTLMPGMWDLQQSVFNILNHNLSEINNIVFQMKFDMQELLYTTLNSVTLDIKDIENALLEDSRRQTETLNKSISDVAVFLSGVTETFANRTQDAVIASLEEFTKSIPNMAESIAERIWYYFRDFVFKRVT